MKDRYGLELPEMSHPPHDTAKDVFAVPSSVDDSNMVPESAKSLGNPRNRNFEPRNGPDAKVSPQLPLPSSLPPEFLATVPPHIAEIMSRKPELVQSILASRSRSDSPQRGSRCAP